jgi:hypothetical protein
MDSQRGVRPIKAPELLVRRMLALLTAIAFTLTTLDARVELAPCKNNYTPAQQIELGNKAKAQVYREMPVLPDTSPITKYVQQLGDKLAAQAPGYKWPYNFHVANVAEINAFALPGGSIFVNLGTIQAAADEDQLAGVMAHEISHVVLQHSVCNAEKQRRVGLIAGLGQVAAGVVLGGAAGQLAAQGIGMTAGLGFLKMSRGAEQQADLEGVGILYDAGYDPRGMPEFFQTIESKYGAGSAQFLTDHPNPGNRMEYINKEIATFVPKSNYIENSPAFARIKADVSGMHAYTAREISSGVWRRRSPNETVGGGMNDVAGDSTVSAPTEMNGAGAWKSFSGNGFSFQIPENWRGFGNRTAAILGPPHGIARSPEGGAGNVVYGMLMDRYHPPQGLRNGSAVDALLSEITRDNPSLVPGPRSDVTVNGATGRTVECNNPAANNGKGEHDWIAAFQQPNGMLLYFVFIAPTPEFEQFRPTFQRILNSLNIES